MCIGTAVALGNPYEEGYNAGCNTGHKDGVNNLSRDPSYYHPNPYDDDDQHAMYEYGYIDGYYQGYDDATATDNLGNKTKPENCMSSPALGLGLKLPDGTITQRGDHVPTLYSWAEVDDKYEHHTTFYYPAEGTHTGCVIVTPPQIAGEPLVESNFWDTPKGQRILQWKANAG